MDHRKHEKPLAQDFAESVAGYEAWRKGEDEKGTERVPTTGSSPDAGEASSPGEDDRSPGTEITSPARSAGMRDGIGTDPPAWHSASCSYPEKGCTCRAWATGPYFG